MAEQPGRPRAREQLVERGAQEALAGGGLARGRVAQQAEREPRDLLPFATRQAARALERVLRASDHVRRVGPVAADAVGPEVEPVVARPQLGGAELGPERRPERVELEVRRSLREPDVGHQRVAERAAARPWLAPDALLAEEAVLELHRPEEAAGLLDQPRNVALAHRSRS